MPDKLSIDYFGGELTHDQYLGIGANTHVLVSNQNIFIEYQKLYVICTDVVVLNDKYLQKISASRETLLK